MTVLTESTPTLLGPLAARRSTRAFDPSPLTDDLVTTLVEAARWAPSAMNRQPWRFVLGRIGDRTHAQIVAALAPGNRVWAQHAPLLVVSFARLRGADPEGRSDPDVVAAFEVGMAAAHLEVQAQSLGLVSHHMGGFDAAALSGAVGAEDEWQALTVLAIGRPGDVAELPEALRERESAPRTRLPLSDLAFADAWGAPADLA